LAASVGAVRLYVARGREDDSLWEFLFNPLGRSASAGPRSSLTTHGARVSWSSGNDSTIAHGIVPDHVTAVRVGSVDATLGENGFIAIGTSPREPVTLMSHDGVRRVEFPAFPLRRNPNASTPGRPTYDGLVEYAQSGFFRLVIADLDDPQWRTELSSFVYPGHAPDPWTVGVVLLDGHRAGELAIADLVLQRDSNGTTIGVEFRGHEGFAPHPDPPRLEAALRRLEDMEAHYHGPERAP
jgi:hypothetical protein